MFVEEDGCLIFCYQVRLERAIAFEGLFEFFAWISFRAKIQVNINNINNRIRTLSLRSSDTIFTKTQGKTLTDLYRFWSKTQHV